MYLSLVEIENFRSFEALTVSLQPGLNVIVGRNNSGKTNLLHAIRHAIGPAASRGDSLWLDRDDFYKSSATDETERTIRITLTFSELTNEQRAHFYEVVNFDLANLSASKAVIRFEASWPKGRKHASVKRMGGALGGESTEVPVEILQSLPVTFLTALRDAEECLAPGYKSRLATLIKEVALREGPERRKEIEAIYAKANDSLEELTLISTIQASLRTTTRQLSGTDYSSSAISAAEIEFEKILRTLQIQMDDSPIGSLHSNGLGYNNLLYMAVILEHLKAPSEDDFPLFLVEEPEAHLHPQLTLLLADYLANNTPGNRTPQTIVTTHSPTLAANVPPNRLHVMFSDATSKKPMCNSISGVGMDDFEQGDLQRMMDITRATLYFAKGALLVEGISEAILLPVLAQRLGSDLTKLHISVIPICGVAFETFKKLLGSKGLGIPIGIITDADPPIKRGETYDRDVPESFEGVFKHSDRTKKLHGAFAGNSTVSVFNSDLTLEFDLANAGDLNADVMAQCWEELFVGSPGTFNKAKVAACGGNRDAKALATWRGICRADHTGSKVDFARKLASRLSEKDETGAWKLAFDVPVYLSRAINDVVSRTVGKSPTKVEADANANS